MDKVDIDNSKELKTEIEEKSIGAYFGFEKESIIMIVKALFLLILSISGNFLAKMFSCQTQRVLSNMYTKHLLLYFLIYFTLDFSSSEKQAAPGRIAGKALFIWILFHIFSRTDIEYTIISFVILSIIYVLGNYKDYFNDHMEDEKEKQRLDNILSRSQMLLFALLLIIQFYGLAKYYFEKKKEYGKKFKLLDFFVGHSKCRGRIH
mgnify:CR=1 FL=1